jgi:hypothetical protein
LRSFPRKDHHHQQQQHGGEGGDVATLRRNIINNNDRTVRCELVELPLSMFALPSSLGRSQCPV